MSYRNLDYLIDHNNFSKLEEEIHIGLVETISSAVCGNYKNQNIEQANIPPGFRTINQAYKDFLNLPDTDPIKHTGMILQQENLAQFSTYLKIAMQAYDPFYHYGLWKDGVEITTVTKYFPNTVKWIRDCCMGVFEYLDSVEFIVCEANALGWEQQELAEYKDFLYIRPTLEKPVYLWDQQNKIYINSKVASWDQNYLVGYEKIARQTYALKLTGVFAKHV
jgi:hypothetical protein